MLVAHAGRYGSTAEVAEAIVQELGRCGVIAESRPAGDVTEIGSYDGVIVGSAIRNGTWLPEALRFVETHEGALGRRPVAYFLTCLELTRAPGEADPHVPVCVDPLLGRPPRIEGKLSYWERTHLLTSVLGPVLQRAPHVEPVSVGVFRGKLDYRRLTRIDWLAMKLVWLLYKRAPEGDFRNWEAIRCWAGSLCPAFLEQR